jgi:hypothetical protein
MKLARRVFTSFLVLALVLTQLGSAAAQPPPSPGDLAIAKGEQALAAFDRRDWEQALTAFREADQLYHSPVFTLYQARCLKALARLLEASQLLDKTRNEQLPESAPDSWVQAKAEAASELLTLEGEVPRVVIRVRNAIAPRATLDGNAVELGVAVKADAGEHRVTVTDGARTQSKMVTLRVGSETRADLDFEQGRAPPPHGSGWLATGITLASVGGAGLIAGAIFGGLALDRSATAEASLPPSCTADKHCPTRDQTAIEAGYQGAYDFAHASDGLFIAGGVLAAAGVVILIVDQTGTAEAHLTTQGGRLGLRF